MSDKLEETKEELEETKELKAVEVPKVEQGIKETKELFIALGMLTKLLIKHFGDGMQLRDAYDIMQDAMRDKDFIPTFSHAIKGITKVPAEIKDLDVREGAELAQLVYEDVVKAIKDWRAMKEANLVADAAKKAREAEALAQKEK
jgi:hypothetical protein